jgi:hypothetical protein
MRRNLAGTHIWIGCRIFGFLLVLCGFCSAAERSSLFEEANRLYEQENYAEAASHYESLAKAGRNSASVLFNLGNAYFKQGQLGKALLNYRKAEALAPRDPDIQANIRFTRDRVSGNLFLRPRVWQRFLNYFTLNELAAFNSVLFWVWAALFCIIRLRRRPAEGALKTLQLIVGTALLIGVCVLITAILAGRDKTVIVTSKQATVHLGPLAESQSAFTASDGTELRLLDNRPDWLQIADRSGRTGWISATDGAVF